MANTDVNALQRSDLNGFLFADVGVEASGMTLSVLSTLARLGMDPWQEAARLAKLPQTAAVEGLARIIAAMPTSVWSLPDATVIAARLVALLPVRGPAVAPAMPLAAAGSQTPRQRAVVVALMGAMLAGLAVNLTVRQGAAVPENVAAARSSAGQAASVANPSDGRTPAGE